MEIFGSSLSDGRLHIQNFGFATKKLRLKHYILLPKSKSKNTRKCHLTFAQKTIARLFLLSVLLPFPFTIKPIFVNL